MEIKQDLPYIKDAKIEVLDFIPNRPFKFSKDKLNFGACYNTSELCKSLLLVKAILKYDVKDSNCNLIETVEIPVYSLVIDYAWNKFNEELITLEELMDKSNYMTDFVKYFCCFQYVYDTRNNNEKLVFKVTDPISKIRSYGDRHPSMIRIDLDTVEVIAVNHKEDN